MWQIVLFEGFCFLLEYIHYLIGRSMWELSIWFFPCPNKKKKNLKDMFFHPFIFFHGQALLTWNILTLHLEGRDHFLYWYVIFCLPMFLFITFPFYNAINLKHAGRWFTFVRSPRASSSTCRRFLSNRIPKVFVL